MRKFCCTFLSMMLFATAQGHEAPSIVQTNEQSTSSQASPSQDCLSTFWARLLPLMAKNNSYISIEDMERVAGVKMQHVVNIGAADRIGIYEQHMPFPSAAHPFTSNLSIRVENHEEVLPSSEIMSTWRAVQWQPGSTSTVDISCASTGATLRVAQAEADLKALGLQRAGVLSKGIQRADVFVNDWNEQVYLFYAIPVIVTPPIISLRIIGTKAPKKPPLNWPK
jgi:hypothetical protein